LHDDVCSSKVDVLLLIINLLVEIVEVSDE
jgi:hypothetical protein